MSQRDRVVIRSFDELAAALGRGARTVVITAPALRPLGDAPRCPCGKVSYETKTLARRAADELGGSLTAYRCPLGHNAYHLHGTGRSRRDRGGA